MDRNPQIDLEELAALHEQCFGWALSQCGFDRAQAEEVLQNTYGAIVAGKARYRGRASLKTWLFAVIKRQAKAERRRLALGLRLLDRLAQEAAALGQPDAEPQREEAKDAVLAALEALSSRQRDVIELVFYRDLTVEEAARVMGVSVGSARQHYARAKEKLARMMGSEI